MTSEIKAAKSLFYQKDYTKALEIFKKHNEFYYTGLCYLLLKDINSAISYWKKNKNNCPGCEFGLIVVDYINFKANKIPSFFQTRAFLEVYISLFLDNDLVSWCENLISHSEMFFKGNPESYKFIARALYSNGYFDLAITFCKKSLDLFYSDPEALLIVAQCYYLLNKKEVARLYIDKLNHIVKDYYPAILFDQVLSQELQ